MKRFNREKVSVKLNSRLSTSIFLLVMMVFSLAGATQAWFSAGDNISQNIFTTGTVSLSEPVMTEMLSMSTRSLVPEDSNVEEPGDGNNEEENNTGEENTGEENTGEENTEGNTGDGNDTGDGEAGEDNSGNSGEDSGEEGNDDEGSAGNGDDSDGSGEEGSDGNGSGDGVDDEEGSGDDDSNGEDSSGDNSGSDDQVLNTEVKIATVAPSCKDISWNFTSTGSKRSYVRVLPKASAVCNCHIYIAVHLEVGGETAWVGVPNGTPITKGSWNQYFVYPLGVYTESNPLELDILYGANYTDTGDAYFWDDGNKLYFNFETVNKEMGTIHIYAGETAPTNAAPGQLGWQFTVNGYSFSYNTAVVFPYQGAPSADVYLSTLYGGAVPVNISLCGQSKSSWIPGSDGWYYYGTVDGEPTVVDQGDNVAVCFTYCVTDGDVDHISVSLEAEAVQWSNGAIDYVWPRNPWLNP